MDATRWEEVKTIMEEALKVSPQERDAFLDRACGSDPALRTQVKAFLDSHEKAPGFFDDLAGSVLGTGWIAEEQTEVAPVEAAPANPHQLIGQTISHYKVHHKLGGGGMGVVYRAEDTQLGRTVALKFLPPHLSADHDAETRFITEAKAASALDHTNICTIYEIGETAAGRLFIAMAYYDGETLKKKIARGPLPMEEALGYTAQLAQGLAQAHARGIVHRDIKPANVIVTSDGVVKILDFGLAKMTDVSLTQPGMALGTVAYMSPEQARGGAVDQSADVWSLGVVLYEMLTGQRPFKGGHAQAIIYNILHHEPLRLTEVNPEVPPELEPVVAMCLEKDQALRYPAMTDLLTDLNVLVQDSGSQTLPGRALTAARSSRRDRPAARHTPPAEERTIVVLPFKDISPGKDNEYFSDGLTEEIITDLSQIQALNVISRTSAMMLKKTDKTIKMIGRELNVGYVLEGSVRKAGNNLRITAQLIDAHNDTHLWAEKYKGTLDDIFDIQERVSQSIFEALSVQLSTTEHRRVAVRPIDNAQAYECYLRARQEIWRWSEDALNRALLHLQNALDIIGENALLYASIGYVHWQLINIGSKPRDQLSTAEAYVRTAFTLDPNSPHGHRVYGLILVGRRDMQGAIRHLKQALAIDPNDSDTMSWLSLLYGYAGKTSAALPLVERLLIIDPLNPLNNSLPGWLHLLEGRFGPALEPFRKTYQMDPVSPGHRFNLIQALAYNQHFEEAYTLIDQLAADAPGAPMAQLCLFFKHALQGDKKKALELATPDLKALARDGLSFAWMMTDSYALIDEKEDALDWLETTVDLKFVHHAFFSRFNPFLENIRGEERFHRLMAAAKEESDQIEA